MQYLRIFWHQNDPAYPFVLISELDEARFEVRKLEIFRNARIAWAGPGEATGADPSGKITELGTTALPPNAEIAANPEFSLAVIDASEFAHHWALRNWYDLTFFPTRVPLAKFWYRSWDQTMTDQPWDGSVFCATYNNDDFYIDLGRELGGMGPYYLQVNYCHFDTLLCDEKADTPEPLITLATQWSHRIAEVYALELPRDRPFNSNPANRPAPAETDSSSLLL
jgi:hypothetical protein